MTGCTPLPVYLDCNATMPIRAEVVTCMADVMRDPGNASATHALGRRARKMIEDARVAVAALAGASPAYIFFTSGATESNNTVIKTFTGQTILISAIEHPSVMEAAPQAVRIPVTADGVINMAALEALLKQYSPALISIMLVNNETGVIQPVAEIVRLVRRVSPQTRVHTDAVQAAGRIPIDFVALQVDYLTLSAHKMGGPQGAGAIIMAPGAKVEKLLHGGGQEKRQRPGTENVAAIAGFGVAATIAAATIPEFQKLTQLRDDLERQLLAVEPRLTIFGVNAPRVANTSQIALPGIAAETQLMALDLAGICVSSGSACASGTTKPNHVLAAMDASAATAMGALRISMGWATTKEDIDLFLAAWNQMHARVKDKIAA